MLPESLTDDLGALSELWLEAKEAERQAVEDRRRIEDRIKSLAGVSEHLEGTETLAPPGYAIKIVGRIERKVDADRLQELAAEHGLSGHLPALFRWKAEVNAAAWKSVSPEITAPLCDAITAKPGRPSFSIARKEN